MKSTVTLWKKQLCLVLCFLCGWSLQALGQAQAQIIAPNGSAVAANQVFSLRPGEYATITYNGSGSSFAWIQNSATTVDSDRTLNTNADGLYQLVVDGTQRSVYFTIDHQAASADRNYAITEQVRVAGIKTESQINGLPTAGVLNQYITYSDGLSRPLQEIAVAAAPSTGKDVVQPYAYGAQGQQTRAYLPYTVNSSGQFQGSWLNDQNNFYQWQGNKVGRPGNGPAYAETVIDADPIGRSKEQAAPGEAWKLGSGHTRKQSQRSNTATGPGADGVRLWTYTASINLEEMGSLSWQAAGEQTLTVSESTDEDGKLQVSYVDERGLLVCSRTYLAGTPVVAAGARYLETNYTYDLRGNLVATIPPEATRQLLAGAAATTILEPYVFVNLYDAQDRVIAQKVPGQRWAYQVYDRWDRLTATQNGNQLQRGIWAFIKYDALNRPIITGEVLEARTQAELTGLLASWPRENRFESRADNEVGYTYNVTYPEITSAAAANSQVGVVQYYDDYKYYPLASQQRLDLQFEDAFPSVSTAPRTNSLQTKGLLTGSRKRTLAPRYDQWLTTVLYYDEFGRLIQTKEDNHTGSAAQPVVQRMSMLYEGITDQITKTRVDHKRRANGVVTQYTVLTENTYDIKGRLYSTAQKIDDGASVTLSQYEYNDLGQVVDKKLGYDEFEETWLQSLDYRYNIRGWLTNINNRNLVENVPLDSSTPNADPDAQKDAFGLELKYESGSQLNNYYNGNISGVIWNSNTPDKGRMRQYSYTYDNANRILGAEYGAYGYSSGSWNWNNEKDAQGKGIYAISGLVYDDNGNIKSLNRNGNTIGSGNTKQYGPMDQLSMDHVGNQLTRVRDAAQLGGQTAAPNDFENGSSTASYRYDDNGNLTFDPNKGINNISYNSINLPSYVEFGNGNAINLLYSSTGEKLQVSSYERINSVWSIKTTDYVGGFIYSTSEPVSFSTPAGRAVLTVPANGTTPARWTQEYHLQDHQGSLRMVLRSTNPQYNRASMELSAAEEEESKFSHLAHTRQYDPTHARTGAYSARLNAHQANRLQGPATTLQVMAGDSVKMRVYGRYDVVREGKLTRKMALASLAVSGTTPSPAFVQDGKARPGKRKLPFLALGTALGIENIFHRGRNTDSAPPQAGLTYQFFNKDSVLVATQTQYLNENSTEEWQVLSNEFTVKEDGYVDIYLTNASGKDAWLDDFVATAYPANTIQENHYDPFGQNLVDLETSTDSDNLFQYTGQEKIAACGINLYDYDSRGYDFQLGRFTSVDEASTSYTDQGPYNYVLNNPINHIDPDGRNPLLIAAVLGAGFNVYAQYRAGNIRSGWQGVGDVLGYGAVGAAGGVVGMLTGGAVAGLVGGGAIGGAFAGAVGGYAGGFYTGYSNEIYFGSRNLKSALKAGHSLGVPGAIFGGVFGGLAGHADGAWVRPDWMKPTPPQMSSAGGSGDDLIFTGQVDGKPVNSFAGNDARNLYEGGEFIGDGIRSGNSPFGSGNGRITITPKGLKHVMDRHTINGMQKWASKSKFSDASDVISLIRQGNRVNPTVQPGPAGNLQRIVDAGRIIGIDRMTGNPTSIYTIITNGQGVVITSFPGRP